MKHTYAAHGHEMPGGLNVYGATAQSIRVPPAIFVQPEVLDQAEVGQPVVKRADRKPANSRKRPK